MFLIVCTTASGPSRRGRGPIGLFVESHTADLELLAERSLSSASRSSEPAGPEKSPRSSIMAKISRMRRRSVARAKSCGLPPGDRQLGSAPSLFWAELAPPMHCPFLTRQYREDKPRVEKSDNRGAWQARKCGGARASEQFTTSGRNIQRPARSGVTVRLRTAVWQHLRRIFTDAQRWRGSSAKPPYLGLGTRPAGGQIYGGTVRPITRSIILQVDGNALSLDATGPADMAGCIPARRTGVELRCSTM